MYQLISEGGILDAGELAQYESQLDEGDNALIVLNLRTEVSQGIADELADRLTAAGVEGVRVTRGSPKLKIFFTKGFPWLAIIAAVILGLIVLAILIVGWQLYKDMVPSGDVAKVITWGLLAAGGIALLVIITGWGRRPRQKEVS